jgi:hypothetical protein
MVAGYSLLAWLIAALVAIFVFFLLRWLIGLLLAALGFAVPDALVFLFCLLVAIGVFVGGPRYYPTTGRRA